MHQDIGLEQAWQLLQEQCPSLGQELVLLDDALGRVLPRNLYAKHDLPPEHQSAVDGYALGRVPMLTTAIGFAKTSRKQEVCRRF